MSIDHSVYPDEPTPPEDLPTREAKADYLHRVCSAFDFGIFPERRDWERFAAWRTIFDAFPLPHSPAYHTFRARFGWDPMPKGICGLVAPWQVQDLRKDRTDPCDGMV